MKLLLKFKIKNSFLKSQIHSWWSFICFSYAFLFCQSFVFSQGNLKLNKTYICICICIYMQTYHYHHHLSGYVRIKLTYKYAHIYTFVCVCTPNRIFKKKFIKFLTMLSNSLLLF